MHILVDCSGSVRGGIARVLQQLEREWPIDDTLELIAAPANFVPHRASIRTYQEGGRASTLLSATKTVAMAARDGQADGLLCLSPSLTSTPSRVPVVTILHDLAYLLWPAEISKNQRRYRKTGYSLNLHRSAVIRCVSHRTLHDLSGQMPWARDIAEHWRLPTPVLTAHGEPSAVVTRMREKGIEKVIVVPGHSAHKGVELAIGGLAELDQSHGLAVTTSTELVDSYRKLAVGAGVSERVEICTGLEDGAYAALIRDSSVMAMCSHFEGLGLPVLEARLLGTRVVVSPDPALWEAADGQAVRMATWTSQAFTQAVNESIVVPEPQPWADERTWREAAEELRQDFERVRSGHQPA